MSKKNRNKPTSQNKTQAEELTSILTDPSRKSSSVNKEQTDDPILSQQTDSDSSGEQSHPGPKGKEGSPGITTVTAQQNLEKGDAVTTDGNKVSQRGNTEAVQHVDEDAYQQTGFDSTEGQTDGPEAYQDRVDNWLFECFGEVIARDKVERNHRFLEESLELVQAAGCSRQEALKLVEYVFSRPVGDIRQEVGGVQTTLTALCSAHDIDLENAREEELDRIWEKIDTIREKQRNKPRFSALPQ